MRIAAASGTAGAGATRDDSAGAGATRDDSDGTDGPDSALLTARAIEADGCRLLGWVGNCIDPAMDALQENLATLRELLPAPCLGVLPHGVAPVAAAAGLVAAVAVLD